MIHKLYILALLIIGAAAVAGIGMKNFDYYSLPVQERPFHSRYDQLKPSGVESHGFGVVGTAMIIAGVGIYSSRKRIKLFSNAGKMKNVLEFHISLCLLGPMLVLYHTTFKFGGIVAVSFWSMMAVVASGIVGRYLYVQIPKGIHGNELTVKELDEENGALLRTLEGDYGLTREMVQAIESLVVSTAPPMPMTTESMLVYLLRSNRLRRRQLKKIRQYLLRQSVDSRAIASVTRVASQRMILTRRIALLEKLKYFFHYWHVFHLPFSIVMFVILILHVGVAVAFGYTWIW